MREIRGHEVNLCNEAIAIFADDLDPDHGNASHHYQISYIDRDYNSRTIVLNFQQGPLQENGNNGVTQEVLLAILIDRLQCFQTSRFACRENALALTKLEEAQHWLLHRTRERMLRGVEGSNTP